MDTESLINYLLQFGSLNKQQIELISSSLIVKTYRIGDFFLRAGQTSKEIGFITNGVFRVCYYDNDGKNITRYFIDELNFIVDISSYNTGIPTAEYVEAVIDCEVLIFTKQVMENLSRTIIIWDNIINKIIAKALVEKAAKVSQMMPQDAKQRYQYFIEKFPNLANRIPLQFIASYIGVTKFSLSRLRREMIRKK